MASPSSNFDQRLDCFEAKLVKLNFAMDGEIRELFDALLSKIDKLIASQSPLPSKPQTVLYPHTLLHPETHNHNHLPKSHPKPKEKEPPSQNPSNKPTLPHVTIALACAINTTSQHCTVTNLSTATNVPVTTTIPFNRHNRALTFTAADPELATPQPYHATDIVCLTILVHSRAVSIVLSSH